ncbi:MAG: DNA repair protein RadC [Oscillospiraceae bacterium]
MQDNPNAGHRQRLKERFQKTGLDSFEPHNVLEFIMFYTNARGDTNRTAHALIEQFGNVAEVFDAPIEELTKISGVGEHTAILFKALPQIAKVYMVAQLPDKLVLDTPKKLGEYLTNMFIGKRDEFVYLLCLDSSLNFIACELLCQGSVDSASISSRKIVEMALRYNANTVVLSHNHPRGVAIPSNADIITTANLRTTLEALDIRLLDHIVVAQNTYFSLAQKGYFTN